MVQIRALNTNHSIHITHCFVHWCATWPRGLLLGFAFIECRVRILKDTFTLYFFFSYSSFFSPYSYFFCHFLGFFFHVFIFFKKIFNIFCSCSELKFAAQDFSPKYSSRRTALVLALGQFGILDISISSCCYFSASLNTCQLAGKT